MSEIIKMEKSRRIFGDKINNKISMAIRNGDFEKFISICHQHTEGYEYLFQVASIHNQLEMCIYLYEEKHVNVQADNDYALYRATENFHVDIIQYIVSVSTHLTPRVIRSQNLMKVLEKSRLKAQRKIYFWWIQICYDPFSKNGKERCQRLALNSWKNLW